MKIWLFITDGRDGYGIEARASEDGVRACAWAWLREIWADYDIVKPMPTDLDAALKLAGEETDEYGRIQAHEVDLVLRSPLVAWLRSHFPEPRPYRKGADGYSVSGALAFYVGAYHDPFPGEDDLACYIEEARGRLVEAETGRVTKEAREAARSILRWDDAGEPDKSWAILDVLLAEVHVERDRVQGLLRAGRLTPVGISACCGRSLIRGADGVMECSECWDRFTAPGA